MDLPQKQPLSRELERALAQPRQSGNREFGLVMASACFVFTLFSAWKDRGLPNLLWPALSLGFFFFALALPRALTPLNKAWSLLGRVLHKVMSPLVLGVLYFGFFTPFGFLYRLVKNDPLRLRLLPEVSSYWIRRSGADQPGKGMERQF